MFSCFFFLPFFFFFSVRLLCVYAGASADVFQMRPNHLATRVLSPQKKLGDAIDMADPAETSDEEIERKSSKEFFTCGRAAG